MKELRWRCRNGEFYINFDRMSLIRTDSGTLRVELETAFLVCLDDLE